MATIKYNKRLKGFINDDNVEEVFVFKLETMVEDLRGTVAVVFDFTFEDITFVGDEAITREDLVVAS